MTARRQSAMRAVAGALESQDLCSVPSALVAVFDAEGVLAWSGVNHRNVDPHTPDRGEVFRIASMSKSFLAAAALALRDEGRLNLEGTLDEWVPGIRLLLGGAPQLVTLCDLLANRSGLAEDNAWGDRRLGDSRTHIENLGSAGLTLAAEPGDRYQYSNLGMSFVGRAIERVVGRAVEEEIADRFLVPLGLSNTHYAPESYPSSARIAKGYRTFDGGQSFAREPYAGSGALACIGGLFSTLDDVATWGSFLASAFGNDPHSPEILAPSSRREMQRPHTPAPVGDPGTHRDLDLLAYGLGLFIEQDRRFGRIVQHSGGLPGFSSHMRWQVATGIGAIVFGNSDAFATSQLAAHALAETLADVGASAAMDPPWPATLAAAAQVDLAIRNDTPLGELGGLLSPNVLQDIPGEIRAAQLRAASDSIGGLARDQLPLLQRIDPVADPAMLRWRIEGVRGSLNCELRLVGLRDPIVQGLTISIRKGGDEAPAILKTQKENAKK